MKITMVRETNIGDPNWYVKITSNIDDTIAEAVNEDHPGCESNTCDIHHALKTGHTLAAAWLLMGATETPALSATIDALRFNGTYVLPAVGFDVWCASEDSESVECPGCGSRVYSDAEYGCGNCGADIPPPSTADGRAAIRGLVAMQWGDDVQASVLAPLFGVVETLRAFKQDVPDETGFRPGAFDLSPDDLTGEWPDGEFVQMYRDDEINAADLQYWARVLARCNAMIPADRRY